MKLSDKVVLVTGASRGIGRAIALTFAKEGARVGVIFSKSGNEADQVVKEISRLGSEAIAVKCDVSNENQVKEMVGKILSKFGTIDILINNAGIVIDKNYKEKTVDEWNTTLGVNLIGSFLCTKYCAPYLLKNKGVIVNISSNNAIGAFSPTSMDYDASKAGIITLTKNFAQELAPNVRVNAIAPGWVNTEMNKDLPKDYIKSETERTWLKRFADPVEIARVALFLSSDDSSFITGSIIIADGGYM